MTHPEQGVKPAWISVEDELPKDKQMCIVWHKGVENPWIARYVGGREFHDFFKNWTAVDCWMPLPDPPEGA